MIEDKLIEIHLRSCSCSKCSSNNKHPKKIVTIEIKTWMRMSYPMDIEEYLEKLDKIIKKKGKSR